MNRKECKVKIPGIQDVREAASRIKPFIHRTPVLTCNAIDSMTGCQVFFKAENFQKAGAFKARGAHNALMAMSDKDASLGVTTHSSGNHAAALALAARNRGVDACIVMPSNAPMVKRAAVEGYGARIVFCEPTLDAREKTLARLVQETGAAVVHPYDDPLVIAGQATAALELLEDVGDLDMVLAPVGGGGLMSGTAITVRALCPAASLVGVEPKGADDAFRSLEQGKLVPSANPSTIADGLLTSLSPRTFRILSRELERIVTVGEDAIRMALRIIMERMKIVVEPSAAVTLAALLESNFGQSGLRVGVILSGGNLELGTFIP